MSALVSLLALLSLLASDPRPKALVITTLEESSIVIQTRLGETGEESTLTIGNRELTVCLPDGATTSVNDLDRPSVAARIDGDRVTWEGNLEITIDDSETGTWSRLQARDAIAVLGPVDTERRPRPPCQDLD